MKAIRLSQTGGPEVLKIEEVPTPVPGENQALVRLYAVGVNPVETYIRAGIYGSVKLPYTPGSDGAGVIDKTGEKVRCFKAGDRVYISGSATGTYAQSCLADEAQLHLLPEHVSFGQGAALGVPYATAYYGLFLRGHARPGEVVLVHGASGGVGTAAVQLARNAGLTVIGTAGTEAGLKLVLQLGAAHALNHKTPDYLAQIGPLTDGKGPDVILEMLANVNLNHDLKVAAKAGRIVVIGSRGSIEIDPRLTMGKGLTILGMSLLNASAAELSSIHAALGAGLRNRSLVPIVSLEIALSDAAKAHRMVMESATLGKIVLVA